MPRYRFSDFTLSRRKRLLIRNGHQLPLIPRYLDLLIFLVERRRDAVHRREIFDRVWSDVIVSDSALSQAIRTLRRTLGDDPREPRFIRTVSRHGYQFTFPDVIEEPDEDVPEPVPVRAPDVESDLSAEARSAKAEQTRQKVGASLTALITGATRACAGSALAGAAAGIAGGLLLSVAPGNTAPLAMVPVLVLVGAGAGAVGGLGVGAGLAVAESSSRLRNAVGLTIGAAAGGAAIGIAVQWLMRWSLAAVVGLDLPIGGGVEGLVIGAAAGVGYAIARRPGSGCAIPHIQGGCRRRVLRRGSTCPYMGWAAARRRHLAPHRARGARIADQPDADRPARRRARVRTGVTGADCRLRGGDLRVRGGNRAPPPPISRRSHQPLICRSRLAEGLTQILPLED